MPFGRSRRAQEPLEEPALLDYALKSLGARMQTERDLRRKLQARALPGPEGAAHVSSVIARLKELGYLSDERFAADFARLRQENRSFGKRRVEQDLRVRGVGAELISATLETAYAETDELALIRSYMEKKRIAPPTDKKSTARVLRRLTAAGFASRSIFTVLRSASDPDARAAVERAGEQSDD